MFHYPSQPHRRRHGPRGYNDPRAFKPWLRDEFDFRCIYCLMRETWTPSGSDAFSVEHIRAQSTHPDLRLDYDNLAYACCGCNSAKQDVDAPLTPDADAFDIHLRVAADGSVTGLTSFGQTLIEVCHLNRSALVTARKTMQQLKDILESTPTAAAQELHGRYFGLPTDLPDLSKLKPPLGNSRSEGVAQSYFACRQRKL